MVDRQVSANTHSVTSQGYTQHQLQLLRGFSALEVAWMAPLMAASEI